MRQWHNEILPEIRAEIANLTAMIKAWQTTPCYTSKAVRLANWDSQNLNQIVLAIWEEVLDEPQTIQAVVGACNHLVNGLDNIIDRVKTIADIIGFMVQHTSILSAKQSEISGYIMITSNYEVETNVDRERHPLPLHRPQPVESNTSEDGHIILGHPLKRHDKYIPTDHLNRMNNVPIRLNKELLTIPMNPPSPRESEQSEAQWEIFKTKAQEHYQAFVEAGNKGFLRHKYDGRGRVYVTNYYCNYQGIDYQKALIEITPEKIK